MQHDIAIARLVFTMELSLCDTKWSCQLPIRSRHNRNLCMRLQLPKKQYPPVSVVVRHGQPEVPSVMTAAIVVASPGKARRAHTEGRIERPSAIAMRMAISYYACGILLFAACSTR